MLQPPRGRRPSCSPWPSAGCAPPTRSSCGEAGASPASSSSGRRTGRRRDRPGRVTLPMSRVERVVESRSALEAYRSAPRPRAGDAQGWADLARWAADHDLLTQSARRGRRRWPPTLESRGKRGSRPGGGGRRVDGSRGRLRARGSAVRGGVVTPAEHEPWCASGPWGAGRRRERREAELRVREAEARAREARRSPRGRGGGAAGRRGIPSGGAGLGRVRAPHRAVGPGPASAAHPGGSGRPGPHPHPTPAPSRRPAVPAPVPPRRSAGQARRRRRPPFPSRARIDFRLIFAYLLR